MPLPEQTIEVSVASGVDETFGEWQIPANRLRELTNAVVDKGGTISKRKGIAAVTYDATSLPLRFGVYGDALLGIGKKYMSVYSNAESAFKLGDKMAWQVVYKKMLSSAMVDSSTETLADCYAGSGFILSANSQPGIAGSFGVAATLTDNTNWSARQYLNVLSSTFTSVRVVRTFIASGYACVVVQDGGDITVFTNNLSSIASTWTSTSYAADFDSNCYVDATTDGTNVYVVGASTTPNNRVRARKFNPSNMAGASTQDYAETDVPVNFGCAVRSGTLYIAYSRYNGATYDVYKMSAATSNLAQSVAPAATTHTGFASAPTKISMGFAADSSNNVILSIYAPAAPRARWSQYHNSTLALIANTSKSAPEYTKPWSKPFSCPQTDRTLQWIVISGINGGLFLCDLQCSEATVAGTQSNTLRLVGVASPRLVANINSTGPCCNVSAFDTYKYVVTGIESDTVEPKSHVHAIITDFNHANIGKVVGLGNLAYIVGGMLLCYDGARLFEAGYAIYPTLGSVTMSGGAGSLSGPGSYDWTATFEWPDARGNMHLSAQGSPVTQTAAANDRGDFNVTHLAITNRQKLGNSSPPIRIVPYRTKLGGSVLFRVPERSSGSSLVPSNDVTDADGLAAVQDGQADTSIGDNPILYTSGGVLDGVMPPCLRDISAWKNRLFGIGEDGQTVWYSTAWQDGVAPWFNEEFTFSVSDDDKELVALKDFDDKLILFKEKSIYICVGEPAQPNGLGSSLTVERVSNDTGCIEPRSIVRGPDGVYFQSARGFCRLTRDLRVEFIGSPVRDTLASFPTVVGATLHDKQSEIQFSCDAGAGNTSVVLVYNYFWGIWIKRVYYESTDGPYRLGDIVVYNDELWLSDPTEQSAGVAKERSSGNGQYADATIWVPMTVTLAWLKLDGLQGYIRTKRVWALLESLSSHGLSIYLARDYENSYYQTETWTSTQVAALSREQFRVIPGRQKCQSFTAKLVDDQPIDWDSTTSTGQGPRVHGFRFLVGVKRGGGFKRLAEGAKA